MGLLLWAIFLAFTTSSSPRFLSTAFLSGPGLFIESVKKAGLSIRIDHHWIRLVGRIMPPPPPKSLVPDSPGTYECYFTWQEDFADVIKVKTLALVSRATVTKHSKLDGLKQQKFIVSRFWRLEA